VRRTEPECLKGLRLGGNESRKASMNGTKTCTSRFLYSNLKCNIRDAHIG
jgi:hypothetical protein